MSAPVCTIIAGPNGAGKTTFALQHLPEMAHCENFVNADMIASGLSPFHPEREWLTAGRLFLAEIRSFVEERTDFAFETTLSGRSYLGLIRRLVNDGWRVHLYFLWLPSVEHCLARVTERVATGGHDIPPDVIARRYPRAIANLMHEYANLCTETVCLDNSEIAPVVIFVQDKSGRTVYEAERYRRILEESQSE